MYSRFRIAFPFALLAPLAAGCGSNSSSGTGDSGGKPDTGVTHHDAGVSNDTGTPKHDTGTPKHDTGVPSQDTGTGGDAGTITVTPAPGSKMIASGIIQVLGKTNDDYLVFYDATQGVSVADKTGTVTQIAKGPPDGGLGPNFAYALGNFVFFTVNYTTHSVSGQTELLSGDLMVWSHTLGTATKLASKAVGQAYIATDSSYIAYLDNATGATGTYGNLGVVAAADIATTGGTDVLTDIVIDTSSTTCAPIAEFSKTTLVASACQQIDGGNSPPTVTAFSGAAWTPTVLLASAGPVNISAFPGALNFAVDTAGVNALVLGSGASAQLSVVGLGGTGLTSLLTPFGAIANGTPYFYLSNASAFALFTEPSGAFGKATITGQDPTTATVTTLVPATSKVFGVAGISPDEKYDVDYNTALDSSTGSPSTLNLRNIATGTSVPLLNNAIGNVFGSTNTFTADSSYVVFTGDLTAVPQANGGIASVGSLQTAAVATGTINTLVPASGKVWDSESLAGGTKLLYNQNYVTGPTLSTGALPNGGATADLYTADAAMASPGTLFITGADANYYATSDGKSVFYSFTQLAAGDGGTASVVAGDGVYVVALP